MTNRRTAAIATLLGGSANTVIVAVQAVILIPLYLHFVGPRLYGAWLASGDLLVWMQAFDLGLPNLLIQRIGLADGAGDDKTTAEYFATGSTFLALLAAAFLVVGLALSLFLPGWLHLTGSEAIELKRCFQLGALPAAVLLANNAVVGLSRGLQDTAWINASVVVSALVGFATSSVLVVTGFGLWSIPLGMIARAATTVLGSGAYLAIRVKPSIWRNLRLSRRAFMDIARTSPATTSAGFAYASMAQCDNALVGLILGPEVVPVFALTRKGVDVIRSVLDTISYSSYAGFAHLIGSGDKKRARQVYDEIGSIRLSLAVIGAAAFIAVNRQLVTAWVGPAQFGGFTLTVCLGIHSIVVGSSYLLNSLYRATGAIVRGSLALVVESATRVPLIIVGLLTLGLPGLPLAGIVTATCSAMVMFRWTRLALDTDNLQRWNPRGRLWLARGGILVVSGLISVLPLVPSWRSVLSLGLGMSVASTALLLWADPDLAAIAHDMRRRFVNIVHPTSVATA